MGLRDILGGLPVLGSRRLPVSINDWKKRHDRGDIGAEKSQVKVCNSENPRMVITDSKQEEYAVYTNSLITCLGVLVYSFDGEKVGLAHSHEMDIYDKRTNSLTENKIVIKMLQGIKGKYGDISLRADIVMGDRPSKDIFNETVKTLVEASSVDENSIRVFYGGPGSAPDFVESKNQVTDTAAKVEYNTRRKNLHVAPDT